MGNYLAYQLDDRDKVIGSSAIEAKSDGEARDQAVVQCCQESPTLELWEGSRMVGRVSCDDQAPEG